MNQPTGYSRAGVEDRKDEPDDSREPFIPLEHGRMERRFEDGKQDS